MITLRFGHGANGAVNGVEGLALSFHEAGCLFPGEILEGS